MHFRIKSNLHGFLFMQLAHNCRYVVFLFAFLKWNDMAVDFFSVHDQLCNPFLYVVRIFYFDLVLGAAEGAVKCKVAEVFRDTRINAKTCEFRLRFVATSALSVFALLLSPM